MKRRHKFKDHPIAYLALLTFVTIIFARPTAATSPTRQNILRMIEADSDHFSGSSPFTMTGLSITGPNSVKEGAVVSYSATAAFSDGTTRIVTTAATWNVDGPHAEINADGILIAHVVFRNQPITVTATYSLGGVTATSSLPATIVKIPVRGGFLAGGFSA